MNLTYRQNTILLAGLLVFEDTKKENIKPELKRELEELIGIVQEHAIMLKDKEMNGEK